MIMILHVHVVCIHSQSRITALQINDTEIKNKIERLQNDHNKLQDAYDRLEKEKDKLQGEYNCREKKQREAMEEAQASDYNGILARLYENVFNSGSSKGITKAILKDMRAEKESLQKNIDDKTSELTEIQTKLNDKSDEVKLERAKTQKLEAERRVCRKKYMNSRARWKSDQSTMLKGSTRALRRLNARCLLKHRTQGARSMS